MRVLAVDPGYERLGLAVLEKNPFDKKEKILFSTCFRTSSKDKHSDRLAQIKKEIECVVEKFSPKHLAIETLFFNKNVKTALAVAESRGVVVSIARSANLEVFEYSPQKIKIAVTGNGKSDKHSVIKMVQILINIPNKKMLDDEFDAIAVGLCHFSHIKNTN